MADETSKTTTEAPRKEEVISGGSTTPPKGRSTAKWVDVVFEGHNDRYEKTERIKTEDGEYGIGESFRLPIEKLNLLREHGYRFSVQDND